MADRELRSIRTHVSAVVLIGLSVCAVAATLLGLGLGLPAAVNTRVDIIKIALSVVAGVGGVVALVVAYRKQRISESAEKREHAKVPTSASPPPAPRSATTSPPSGWQACTRWRRSPTSGPTTRRRRCACRSPA